MSDPTEGAPESHHYAASGEESEKINQATRHEDDLLDDRTNKIVLGLSAAGLLGAAGALAVRRLNRKREQQ